MRLTHVGMGISESDWDIAVGHINDTLDTFSVGSPDRGDLFRANGYHESRHRWC